MSMMQARHFPPAAIDHSSRQDEVAIRPTLTPFQRIARCLALCRQRIRSRRRLRRLCDLDDRTLKDIGMTRGLVYYESGKPFWRP
jgi:uncharacterized protein YjiS (DUF1127 family)